MGFFESHLSTLGRRLDDTVGWGRDRARAAADRQRHARSFEAIRDNVERATEQAKTGAERSVDAARSRWSRRDPIDREQTRTIAAWVGVLAAIIAGGAMLRALTSPDGAGPSEGELAAIRAARSAPGQATGVSPGVSGWIRTSD